MAALIYVTLNVHMSTTTKKIHQSRNPYHSALISFGLLQLNQSQLVNWSLGCAPRPRVNVSASTRGVAAELIEWLYFFDQIHFKMHVLVCLCVRENEVCR